MNIIHKLQGIYFWAYSSYGVSLPFLPLILREQGLPDADLALSLSAMGVAALIGPPVVGSWCDRRSIYHKLLPCLLILCALVAPILLACTTFITCTLALLGWFVLYIPAISLLDQYCLSLLSHHNLEQSAFQRIRRFGSLGFMLPSVILLALTQLMPIGAELLLLLNSIVLVIAAAWSLRLPQDSFHSVPQTRAFRTALKIARRTPLNHFFGATFIVGVSVMSFYFLSPMYLRELGCPTAIIGAIVNLGVVWEILLIPHTSALVRRLGAERVIFFGMLAAAARFALFALSTNVIWLTALQILHAPLVVGMFIAVPIYLRERSAANTRYSLQGLYGFSMLGFARIAGPIFVSLTFALLQLGTLEEVRIALLLAGVLGTLGCVWFGLTMFRSRASGSLTTT